MAIEGSESLEQRVARTTAELRRLRETVDALTLRLVHLERAALLPTAPGSSPRETPSAATDESLWSWVGESRVLPRVAMVSFVLVVALVLRTLADSGVFGAALGVLLGVAYAVVLVAVGWRLLAGGRRGQRVLPVSGMLLLCSMLLEAHGSFELLSAASASWILLAALAVLTALGLRYHSASILGFSVTAAAVTSIALGFPHPSFPHTAIVLLAANLCAALALRVPRTQWLSWITFGLTLFLWSVWAFQANAFLREPEAIASELHVDWYLPLVLVFVSLFTVLAIRRALAPTGAFLGFHAVLPAANVLWAYGASLAVVVPRHDGTAWLAPVAVAVAIAHLAFAGWLSRRDSGGSVAMTAFVVAGIVLFAWASPSLLGDFTLALPLWSVLALGLLALSTRCGSVALRLLSGLLQILVGVLAVTTGVFAAPADAPVRSIAAALALCALAWAQYRFARSHPPPEGTWLARVDKADRASVVLLWIAAVSAFGLSRIIAWEVIVASGVDADNTFRGVQSAIINCASIALMVHGIRTRSGEILATAVLVAIFGGLKVVGSDLLAGHGVPLVVAVASLGAAAAVGSIVLGKWLAQRSAAVRKSSEPVDVS